MTKTSALLLCLLTFPAQAQQAQCLPLDRFASLTAEQGFRPAAAMKDADGERREIWVKPDGQWVQIWYPARGHGQVICIDSGGSDFETHFPAKTGRGA